MPLLTAIKNLCLNRVTPSRQVRRKPSEDDFEHWAWDYTIEINSPTYTDFRVPRPNATTDSVTDPRFRQARKVADESLSEESGVSDEVFPFYLNPYLQILMTYESLGARRFSNRRSLREKSPSKVKIGQHLSFDNVLSW
jgi:hypothetical protein